MPMWAAISARLKHLRGVGSRRAPAVTGPTRLGGRPWQCCWGCLEKQKYTFVAIILRCSVHHLDHLLRPRPCPHSLPQRIRNQPVEVFVLNQCLSHRQRGCSLCPLLVSQFPARPKHLKSISAGVCFIKNYVLSKAWNKVLQTVYA